MTPPGGLFGVPVVVASVLSMSRFLMSLARVMKASSTLMEFLAEVSRNLMPYSSASALPRALSTTYWARSVKEI